MAIAHICLDCGWDLARVRPRKEPHYGLNIVTCPRCAGASVRSRHPLLEGWKTLRRVDWALTVLAVQVILFAAATVASVLSVAALIAAAGLIVSNNAGSDIGWFIFVPLVIVAPLLGAWLTAGFSHHRPRWLVWMAWFGWIVLVMIVMVVSPLIVVGQIHLGWVELGDVSTAELTLMSVALAAIVWMTFLTAFMTAAFAGIPLGLAFLWLAARARTQQWRWRRRTRRSALVAG